MDFHYASAPKKHDVLCGIIHCYVCEHFLYTIIDKKMSTLDLVASDHLECLNMLLEYA